MSAQIPAFAQRAIDNAARNNNGTVASTRVAQTLSKRGLAILRDGEWSLSSRGWARVSEWVLRTVSMDEDGQR